MEETLKDVLHAIEIAAGEQGGSWFSREAERLGYKLVYTTPNHILAGTYRSKASGKTLEAIAAIAQAHGVDPFRVYAAAARNRPTRRFAESLPDGVDDLDPRMQKILLDLIAHIVSTSDLTVVTPTIDFAYQAEAQPDLILVTDADEPATLMQFKGAKPRERSVTGVPDDLRIPATGGDEPGTHGDGHEFDV